MFVLHYDWVTGYHAYCSKLFLPTSSPRNLSDSSCCQQCFPAWYLYLAQVHQAICSLEFLPESSASPSYPRPDPQQGPLLLGTLPVRRYSLWRECKPSSPTACLVLRDHPPWECLESHGGSGRRALPFIQPQAVKSNSPGFQQRRWDQGVNV